MSFFSFIDRQTKDSPQQFLLLPCFILPWLLLFNPLLSFGPWPYVQPLFIVLIFLCFFLAAGLALYPFLFTKDKKQVGVEFNYAAAIPFGIAIWSCIALFFSHVPQLSWIGPPQNGMGIVWYFTLSIMIIGYKLLLTSRYQNAFIVNLIVASFVVCCLCFMRNNHYHFIPSFKWTPNFIREHMSFIGISLIGIGLLLTNKGYRNLIFILGLLIVVASTNRSSFIAITIGVLLSAVVYYLNKNEKLPSAYIRGLVAVFIFLIPVFIYLGAKYISSEQFLSSFYSRYHYWHTCIDALLNNPGRILFGFGWGGYTDIILSNIHNMPVRLIATQYFCYPGVKCFALNWNEVGLNINMLLGGEVGFHSHSQFIEVLISVGIVGELLFSALLALPVLLCERSKIAAMTFCAVALSLTFSAWYEIPVTLPYFAIFMAMAIPNTPLHKRNFTRILRFIALCMAVILLVTGLATTSLNLRFDEVCAKFFSYQHRNILDISTENYIDSSGPGGIYHAILMRSFFEGTRYRPLSPTEIIVLQRLLEASWSIKNISFVTLSSELPFYNYLMNKTQDPRLNNFKEILVREKIWQQRLSMVLANWYDRTDLLIPYFEWQAHNGQKESVQKSIKKILSLKGNNIILSEYLKNIGGQKPTVSIYLQN